MKREKKLFIGCFNKSVILTYIGVIFALAGIFILIDLQEAEQMNLVMFCLIISVAFSGNKAIKQITQTRNDQTKSFWSSDRYIMRYYLICYISVDSFV